MKIVAKIIAGLVIVLALLLGGFVAATWAPERTVAELQARWAPPPSVFVDIAGMRVHLRDEGPREDESPIVLLHGMGSSLHAWEGWAKALTGERRVVSFDLPGYGLTGPSPDRLYGGDHDVRFVIAVLDKLGIKRCVLGGNSLGAGLSLRTALTHPTRVDKLILVDGGYWSTSESLPVGLHLLETPGINWLLKNTLPRFLVEQGLRHAWGDASKIPPDLVERSIELTQREGNRGAMIDRFSQRERGSASRRISELKLPTLIMWGGLDRLVPIEAAHRLRADIAGSTLVVFEGLGHAPEEEDPAGTAAAVKRFLQME
jgi:pimeloyl-ACP methyl ester carboxylesterase